jgi:hypothetical protein
VSDEPNSFALRHQARRAAALADLLHEIWDSGEEFRILADEMGLALPDAASLIEGIAWSDLAGLIAERTGEPFRPPSDTTKAITIGLLSAPALKGLVG